MNDSAKYISRCQYYGKLKNWEYVDGGAMVLSFIVYSASEYFGGSNTIRIYVPTELEDKLINRLIVGEMYFVIAAPYKVCFKTNYKHRVDLLLNIFQEV